jgi:hypothetical protein
MDTSGAASERKFSTFGFVHAKLRNYLTTDKVKKLVYIKTNFAAFADVPTVNGTATNHEDVEESVSEADGMDSNTTIKWRF